MATNFPHLYDGKQGRKKKKKKKKKKNNYRSNLAIQKEETFIFNSAAVDVTSTLYPSYLIAFFS